MECRLIRLGNGDVECERCKTKYGNFKNTTIPVGLGKKCKHHSVVKTFNRFAKSAAKHIANGGARATASVYKKRLQICRDCEFYNNDNPQNPKCNECGCFLLVKASWASEACPLQKWVATQKKKVCGCSKKKSKNTS